MAGDTKLLGTLQLDAKGVKETINEVNNALKTLGQGVDLDLTKIVNVKVNSQLNELKKQIDEINKAATGMGASQRDQVNQAVSLMKQQIDLENKMMKQGVSGAYAEKMHDLQKQYVDLTKNFTKEMNDAVQSDSRVKNAWTEWENTAERVSKKYSSISEQTTKQAMDAAQKETKYKLEQADKVAKADEKIAAQKQKQFDKEYAQLEKAEKEKLALEQSTVEKQRELEANSYAAWWKEALDKRDMEKKLADESVQSQIQSATKLLKEQADIEKRLASGIAGPNETNVLNQRLAANKEALKQYSDEIMNTAKADASVVEAQQGVAMAQAQAQDRILKENQKAQEEATKAAEANAKRMKDYQKQWANYAVSALGAASLAVLKKQWTEAIDYATKYYDALNEIRIVSNDMSQQDVDQFGQKMRDLAEEMKVTSTELSQAAITFFRQGLEPAEVEDRLKWVTEYAKVAHMEFNDAAQLMTAAINTMGDSIQESGFENVVEHIADVWLYLGDNAATSGEEIGKAMQKASASAQEFGMSFEWLGTYIAVVSEQTRQAPEAIGNAFNTMMARMHQIKANGFNDEDTTKLNDVAKALATINVELMDSDGEWRDMSDIYSDIADKWGEMDAKQRGYIATTMAGTRQQNVFYALMNDLSKGIEGGSRAWELYTGAMTSAGTATQKYAVYQESIAASQADMQNSLEQLYSNVTKPDMIKGFYNVITMLVDGLNNLGGVLPVVTAGIIGLGVAFKTALSFANPLVAVMAGAAAILGSLVGMGILGNAKTPDVQAARYNQAVQEYDSMSASIKKIQELQNTVNTVWKKQASGAQITSAEMARYNSALQQIATLSPNAAEAVGQLTQGLVDQEAAIKAVSQALDDESERAKARQREAARGQFREWQSGIERSYVTVEGSDVLEELKKIGYDDTGSYESRMISLARSVFGMQDKLLLGEQTGLSDAIMETVAEYWDSVIADLDKEAAQGWRQNPDVRVDADAQEMGKRLWDKLIGDVLGGDDYQKLIEERMNDLIAHALKTVNLDNATLSQVMELREKLKDVIIGEDGILTADDLSEGVKVLIEEVLHAFEGEISGTLPNVSIAEQLAEALGMSPDDFSESFILSDEAIADDMIQSLYDFVAAGEDVDRIFDALNTSANWKEFAINMGFVKQALSGDDGSGGGNEPGDFVKNIKAAYTEIDKIQSVLDSMKEKKAVKLKDLLELGESHPEIIAVANDITALAEKLEELQQKSKESIRENLKQSLLGADAQTGDFKSIYDYAVSQGATGIKTVEDLRSFFENNNISGWVNIVDSTITTAITGIMGLSEETKALTSDFDDFLTSVSNLKQAKEALQIFQDLTNGKAVDDTKIANAAKAISTIFPNLKLDPKSETFVKDLTAAVANLESNTTNAGTAFGALGQAIIDSVLKGEEALDKLKYATEDIVNSVIESGNHDAIGAYMEKNFGGGNVDLLNRKVITNEDGSWSTLDTQGFSNEAGTMYVVVTPITPDGERLTDDALQNYVDELLESGNPLEADKIESGGKGLLLFSEDNISDLDAAIERYNLLEGLLHDLQDAYYSGSNLRGFAKQAAEDMKDATAAASKYKNELSKLSSAFKTGGMKALSEEWARLDDQQEKVAKAFPNLLAAINKFEKATENAAEGTDEYNQAVDELNAEFEKTEKLNAVKYFENTAKAILESTGTQEGMTEAIAAFNTEQEKAIEVQDEYSKIVNGDVELTEANVSKMASMFNMSAKDIVKSWDVIGSLMEQLGVDMESVRAALQEEILMTIVGSSSADFSNIMNGLTAVESEASAAVQALLATGQFEIQEKELDETMTYKLMDLNGNIIDLPANSTGRAKFIVPKGGSIPNTTGGNTKGGGGGGGGNKQKTTSASTKALDRMERIQALQDHTRSLYSAQAGYYEQTGQIDLVIKYHQKEMEAIRDKNATLEENIAELEDWIAKKREEIAALDKASEEYETAQKELDALEDRHREYTLAIIENKTELESLMETIKDLKNEVRDMQIDLYDEVVAALEARDAAAQERLEGTISVQEAILDVIENQKDLEANMLSGRVSMENTVLEIIQAQAETQNKELQARVSIEDAILGIIQTQAETQKKALQARASMENTILGLIQAQVAAEQSLIGAVVSVQNAVANMIKSQVDAQKSMKQARSSMEDMLSGIVKSNLEAQASAASAAGDAADANQAQIEALREQKELLDEQLRLRKEMAKEQDKQAELAELEAQYARISADPTRLKEAMKIRQKIDKIRDEIAWDIAEKEVEEQKKAIDEQIDALSASSGGGGGSSSYEVNMNEVNSQVENILDTMSDEEIIEWLQEHSLDYENATKIGKELMVQEWQAALDEMHGISENYADEVAEVMAMSDEEMMEWFKTNSIEYQEATAERRIQMETEWQQMLDEMHGKTEAYAEEVNSIMEMSDAEMMEWFKNASVEYQNASSSRRAQMETEWQQMLDEMHGKTETYAEEVSSIMEMSDAEMMEWFKNTSVEYQNASSSRRAQMEAEWQEMLDEMHGKTETYAEEIAEVLNKPREEILQWLMENDEEYAHASDAQKQELVDGWNETLDTMYGTSEDHWTQVNAIMAGGLESFLNFMRTNDEEYAKMSAEQKQKTEQEWTDMWNKMIGKQKSYEEEANAIIAKGQDAIIELLGEYTTKYQNVGKMQSDAYLDEWMEKLKKLKAAISNVESLEVKTFDYTTPEAASEAGESEKAEETKKGWRVEANWSNVFDSKAEAEAFKQSKIASIQEQLNANPTDANLKSRLDTWKSSPINMYAKGGMNYRTGLAWLDGTPEDPERILSPYQTELFEILVRSMEEMSRVSIPTLPNFGGDFMTGGSNSSLSFGDIIVNVEHLDSDTDYDDMAGHVLDSVMEKINRSAVVGGIRYSR